MESEKEMKDRSIKLKTNIFNDLHEITKLQRIRGRVEGEREILKKLGDFVNSIENRVVVDKIKPMGVITLVLLKINELDQKEFANVAVSEQGGENE